MRYGWFRFAIALLAIGAVAALVSGAYSAGFVAGAGTSATSTSPWIHGGFYGMSGIVGLVVTILMLVILFRVLSFIFWRRAFAGRGPWAPGAPGDPTFEAWHAGRPGGWHARRWEARTAAFEEWHRRAHEAGQGGPATGQTPGQTWGQTPGAASGPGPGLQI